MVRSFLVQVHIDTGDVTPVDFSLTPLQKADLVARGHNALKERLMMCGHMDGKGATPAWLDEVKAKAEKASHC